MTKPKNRDSISDRDRRIMHVGVYTARTRAVGETLPIKREFKPLDKTQDLKWPVPRGGATQFLAIKSIRQ